MEPGGTTLGRELRILILDPDIEMQPETEFDLFTVGRRELTQQVIKPKMESGAVLVCDRNWFSSVAYQGFGRGLDTKMIIEQTKKAMGDYFMPDGIVILDVPLEITEERLAKGRSKIDWFEKQGREFFEKVKEGYSWLAEEFEVEVIDGSSTIEEVELKVYSSLGSIALS